MATIKGNIVTYDDGTSIAMTGKPRVIEMRGGFYVIAKGFLSSRFDDRSSADKFLYNYLRMTS